MCGPLALSGGVSNHTKHLIKALSKLDAVDIRFFNFTGSNIDSLSNSSFTKTYRRTLGLFFESVFHKKQYDLIHVQTSGGLPSFISSITGVFASKVARKKLVVTFHHSKTEEFVQKYKILFGFVLKNADKLILVSGNQKEVISSIFPKYSSKLIIIPNGYDSSLFSAKNSKKCRHILNLPCEKKIICNISNLFEVKGHKYLIEAMQKIIRYRKDILCIIVGQGYLKDDLEKQIKVYELDDYVKLLGWKSDEEIPIYMNSCDIFVLSSLNEGNPTVMFECLGCGVPYVGSKVGGVPEIISSEDYGLLCDAGDSFELAKLIFRALDKEWNRDKICDYAKKFTWDNIADTTKEVYYDI